MAVLSHGETFMGSEGRLDPDGTLDLRLLGDEGWEEIAIYDADRLVWRRDEQARLGASSRHFRVRLGGARIKDRYRGAWWSGEIRVIGAQRELELAPAAEHRLFVNARQRDQSRVWTSALFLSRA